MLSDAEIEVDDDIMDDEEFVSSSRSKRPGPEDDMAPPAKRRKLHADDADDATSTRTNDFGSPKEDLDVVMSIDEALEDQFSIVPPELMLLIFSFFDERTLMRVQRVNRLWQEISWSSRTRIDFGQWTTQPSLELLLTFAERCNPSMMRKLVFMDVQDISQRLNILKLMSHLQTLSVSTCNSLDADGMRLIGETTSLSCLEMHRCGREVPEHTMALKGLSHLTRLDMGLIGRMADESLEFLTGLTNMQILEISRSKRISMVGLRYISGLTQLRSLDMTSCTHVESAGLECLSALHNMEFLRIARCQHFNDTGLYHLTNLTNLRNLDMRSIRITNAGMSIFSSLTNLESVDLKRCSLIGDPGIKCMAGLVKLRSLTLAKCFDITGAGLSSLSKMTSLTELDLSSCKIDDGELNVLENFPLLKKLKVTECQNFTGESLQWLNASSLRELQLDLCLGLKESGLEHVGRFTNLVTLNISSTYMGHNRLRFLSHLTALENLMAQACVHIDDNYVTYLKPLTKLQFLDLGYCNRLSDTGIVHLSVLTNLRTLYLTKCIAISHVGIKALQNVSITQ